MKQNSDFPVEYRSVHPFPARMAPEIALDTIGSLNPRSIVVDPMCGSGQVLREAVEQGHKAIGFDIDPLAVLMSRVWTVPLDTSALIDRGESAIEKAEELQEEDIHLPWIDSDDETSRYIDFWFDPSQRGQLRKLAFLLAGKRGPINYALQLAVSRTIVTKKIGASLAWDVSHSRPHRKKAYNHYDVFSGFRTAVLKIANEVVRVPQCSDATVFMGNARRLGRVPDCSVDAVITSPPYFNAIDYLRGHRLALVWLGYKVSRLRHIRSRTVGSERILRQRKLRIRDAEILNKVAPADKWRNATRSHILRYMIDLKMVISEISRVLRRNGQVVMVVGNSSIRGNTLDNAYIIGSIGETLGLNQISCIEREIPSNRRYLPPPDATLQKSLQKRMRVESILTLEKS